MSADAEAQTRLAETIGSVPVEVTDDAADLVERMAGELGLWATEVDAGLFLASVAVAHDREPVPAADRTPGQTRLGTLADSQAEAIDHLAMLGALGGSGDLASTLREDLPGWIETGARLLADRLEGADAVEATEEVVEMVRDSA